MLLSMSSNECPDVFSWISAMSDAHPINVSTLLLSCYHHYGNNTVHQVSYVGMQ